MAYVNIVRPICAAAIDSCWTSDVATRPTIISTTAPQRSAPGARLKKAHRESKLIPLAELEKTFIRITDKEKVRLAYEQAQSLVEFIVKHYRFSSIREALERLKSGEKTGVVVEELFKRGGLTLEERWRRYLEGEFR